MTNKRGRKPSTNPKSQKEPKKEHVYIEKEYKLSPCERELHIYMDDIDKKWKADVTIPTYIKKLIKQGWVTEHITYYKDGTPKAGTFVAPKAAITLRNLTSTKKRTLSEDHKAKLRALNKNYNNTEISD